MSLTKLCQYFILTRVGWSSDGIKDKIGDGGDYDGEKDADGNADGDPASDTAGVDDGGGSCKETNI